MSANVYRIKINWMNFAGMLYNRDWTRRSRRLSDTHANFTSVKQKHPGKNRFRVSIA
jgi:hypothetical protein